MMKYLLTIVYIIFTTCGITLMKLGGDSLSISFSKGLNFKIGWITCLGFISYIISFLLWQKLLVKYDLSTMVPIVTGITQIIIVAIGYTILKEPIKVPCLIGAIVIIFGIIIMALGSK